MPTPRKGETQEACQARENARHREARAAFKAFKQTVQFDAAGTPGNQSVQYGPEREAYVPLPGATLARRSTLVDAEGDVMLTWQIEKPEEKARWEAMQTALDELRKDMPRAPVIPLRVEGGVDHLMSVYPVGDHHLGMLAWKYEVGASYDLDIGEKLLADATDYLVKTTPPSKRALLAFLGDFVHYDGMVAVTPQNKNPLDADGRAAKMVRAAMRTMRHTIETVARKHEQVHVVIEFGNHDPNATLWLMEAMAMKYEDNPRITIDCSPGAYHYFTFGKNLIGTHHGDKVKMEKLPGIMAHDRPVEWGATEHRYWYTGHIHSRKAEDFPGCMVESFRILPPTDAWAHMSGYRSERDMKALVLHREHGEVARYGFRPGMMENAA